MLSARNLYLAGTGLLTIAAAIEGGLVPSLGVAGISLVVYGFGKLLAQAGSSL
jgi:hypothetical protein